jgi:RND family efflux transporter MFP subunit
LVAAPIGGRISRRLVTPGNLVQGGSQPTLLTTIVSQNPIYCYFDADERVFLNYQKGGASGKTAGIACELALAGETGYPHQGRIDFHENQAHRATGTMRMRGVFDNPDGALIPGGFASVRLPVERVESALLIPEAAIASEQTRKFVYVLNGEQIVEPRLLQLGRPQGAQRIVLAGLKPEDRVVVNGLLMLRPGIKVEVVDPNTPAAARP